MKEEATGFVAEFKEFISKGSAIDMAVGIVIGAAFTAIVNSLVDDIITPLLGIILGGIDFSGLAIQIGSATVTYGMFIQAVINFLLISLVIFILIKVINSFRKKEDEEEEETTPDAQEITNELLEQIREELKAQNAK